VFVNNRAKGQLGVPPLGTRLGHLALQQIVRVRRKSRCWDQMLILILK